MLRVAVKTAAVTGARTTLLKLPSQRPIFFPSSLVRFYGVNAPGTDPVAFQMINYALDHARSKKSEESYAEGLLVLEQCLSAQLRDVADTSTENSKGAVFLAMSTLLSERGDFSEAIEKLEGVLNLTQSSLGVRVAAMESLIGLHLEMEQDHTSSVLADKCLQLISKSKPEYDGGNDFEILDGRAKSVKGLVELVGGNLESASSYFVESLEEKNCSSTAALSHGEFLHVRGKFSPAKELYQKIIDRVSNAKDFSDPVSLAACNMVSEEVLLGATCALGQLEAHSGNFSDAEDILTRALTKVEERYGSHHPKVGVILTCIALMFRHKAKLEQSSSILIQEGLYRRAIELLRAPTMSTEDTEVKVDKREIVALARGGYAEILCLQQNRKGEGERMRNWATAIWKKRRMSLAEALEISEPSSKVPVIDARISRVL